MQFLSLFIRWYVWSGQLSVAMIVRQGVWGGSGQWGLWGATKEGRQCPAVTSESDNHRSVAELGRSAITTLLVGSHYWWCGGQFSHFGPPPPRAAGFSQRHTDPGQIQSSWANLGLIFPANCKLFRQRFCYYVWWANANYPSRFKISPFHYNPRHVRLHLPLKSILIEQLKMLQKTTFWSSWSFSSSFSVSAASSYHKRTRQHYSVKQYWKERDLESLTIPLPESCRRKATKLWW